MTEEVVKSLLVDYNTRVLSNLSKDDQKKVVEKLKNNQTLQLLIKNFYKAKKPVYKFISGPMSLTQHWSETYEKMIYIFGEWHGHKEACGKESLNRINIQDYLLELFKNTDVFIDFYLEVAEKDKLNTWLTWVMPDYISKLRSTFNECVHSTERHNKKCRLIRAHYIDVRVPRIDSVSVSRHILKIQHNLLVIQSTGWVRSSWLKKIKNSIEELALKTKKDVTKLLTATYEQETKKEIDRVYPKKMKFIIKKYMSETIKNLVSTYWSDFLYLSESIVESISEYTLGKISKSKLMIVLNEYSDVVISMLSPMVDIYTISRIFKKFNTTRSPGRGKTGFLFWQKPVDKWEQPVEPSNIIIYVGNYHAERLRKFFSMIGFQTLYSGREAKGDISRDVRSRCLDMGGVPQPLFDKID